MVSLRGPKKLGPRPDRSLLEVSPSYAESPPTGDRELWNEYKTQTVTDCELKTALRGMDI